MRVRRVAEQVEEEQEQVGPAHPSGEERWEEGVSGFEKESQCQAHNAQDKADQRAGQGNPRLVPGSAGFMGNLGNSANAGQGN